MTRKGKCPILSVTPRAINALDISYGIYGEHTANFIPYGYNCTITLSPIVVNELLKWAIRNGYIEVVGEVRYKVDTQTRKVKGNGEQKDDA